MGKINPTVPSVMEKKIPTDPPEYKKNVEYVDPLMQTLIQPFTKLTSDNLSCQESK